MEPNRVTFPSGTTEENESYTGRVAEVTVDIERKELRLHDDETPGGTPITGEANLGSEVVGNVVKVTCSTGEDTILPLSGTNRAGVMSKEMHSKVNGITPGAQVNVGTNLTIGGSSIAPTITSSTGNNVALPIASTTHAGLMSDSDKQRLEALWLMVNGQVAEETFNEWVTDNVTFINMAGGTFFTNAIITADSYINTRGVYHHPFFLQATEVVDPGDIIMVK